MLRTFVKSDRQLAAIPGANVNWQFNKCKVECVLMDKDPQIYYTSNSGKTFLTH